MFSSPPLMTDIRCGASGYKTNRLRSVVSSRHIKRCSVLHLGPSIPLPKCRSRSVRSPISNLGAVMNATLRLLAALILQMSALQSHAQTWPAQPLHVIVSQAAGSTPDIICRLVMDRLSRGIGQQIVVENRPGGGNVIGAQAAARSAPDGYTLFFATAAALVTNPYTFKSLPYDPLKDFVPISMVANGVFVVLSHPGVPAT